MTEKCLLKLLSVDVRSITFTNIFEQYIMCDEYLTQDVLHKLLTIDCNYFTNKRILKALNDQHIFLTSELKEMCKKHYSNIMLLSTDMINVSKFDTILSNIQSFIQFLNVEVDNYIIECLRHGAKFSRSNCGVKNEKIIKYYDTIFAEHKFNVKIYQHLPSFYSLNENTIKMLDYYSYSFLKSEHKTKNLTLKVLKNEPLYHYMYNAMPENLKSDSDICNMMVEKIIYDINNERLSKSDHILFGFRQNQRVLDTIYQKYGSYQFDCTNGVLEYGDD